MSRLGDLIVDHGRYHAGQDITGLLKAIVNTDQLNALHDELVNLRNAKTALDALHTGPPPVTHHLDGSRTRCCQLPPFELPRHDRLTLHPEGVTCTVRTHHAQFGRGLTTCCRTPTIELPPTDVVTAQPGAANCGGHP